MIELPGETVLGWFRRDRTADAVARCARYRGGLPTPRDLPAHAGAHEEVRALLRDTAAPAP